MIFFPFQCIHPPSSRFTTEPPKQAATEPTTPIHSSADVEGHNHHRVLLLAEPASSLPSPSSPTRWGVADTASSLATGKTLFLIYLLSSGFFLLLRFYA
ncbi:uncharacterized protein DS421_9g265260 [Arachis hypogaea]|nr:uncharacterized protein DS421_9g265260 [Arachis hypogaea]